MKACFCLFCRRAVKLMLSEFVAIGALEGSTFLFQDAPDQRFCFVSGKMQSISSNALFTSHYDTTWQDLEVLLLFLREREIEREAGRDKAIAVPTRQ